MRDFTTAELGRMEGAQEAAMMDVAVRWMYSKGEVDEYGKPAVVFIEGVELVCGFDPSARPEAMDGAEVVMADAVMRLPQGTELDARDRLEVTERFGVLVEEPEVFEVIGEAERGPSGLVLRLRRVVG